MNNQPRSSTSILLILLTLITGIGLGWLLSDTLRYSAAPPFPATAPSATDPSASLRAGNRRPTAASQLIAPVRPSLPADDRRPTAAIPSLATLTPFLPPDPQPPTPNPQPPTPNPQSPIPEVAGYIGHVVAPGESLATIAELGGSTP